MTLGNFMRDYLYIPLGGNRVSSKYRLYFNLALVFILSGFWHGASWNFIIWGAFHGTFLILDRIFLLKVLNKVGAFIAIPFTFLVVMIGWVIFSIEDIGKMGMYLGKLFEFSPGTNAVVIPAFWPILVIALVFAFLPALSVGQRMQQFVFDRNKYSMRVHGTFLLLAVILSTSA